MVSTTLPLFPEDIPAHPLLVIDYERIKAGDTDEIEQLWTAATKLGFWYLKNHGVDEEVDKMFDMAAETMALSLEEKMEYDMGHEGMSFGYKAAGTNAINASGMLDTVEFLNVAKDDALAWPAQVHRSYPSTVDARMESTIAPFVTKSIAVNNTLLDVFNDKLGLPKGTLLRLHRQEEHSGCATRSTLSPPIADRQVISAHTDFGSLTFLHNRLGGLQVFPPGAETWQYVKPIPGHAICNLGDAMVIFSGGILRSNIHRVVNPPGGQGTFPRSSLVYFMRPADTVVLRALTEGSPLIAEAVASSPDVKNFDTGVTAREWLARRIKNQRIKNYKGPESWMASRGTEHTEHTSVAAY
ncbi:Clavaminate synthase-like protein [Mycena latifolia]|nr:Clavaminate synthase-like protein [Mycena latifolia]